MASADILGLLVWLIMLETTTAVSAIILEPAVGDHLDRVFSGMEPSREAILSL